MEITINGNKSQIADGATVASLVELNGQGTGGIAIGRNGKLVRREQWESTVLSSGDEIVIIKAAYGG